MPGLQKILQSFSILFRTLAGDILPTDAFMIFEVFRNFAVVRIIYS